MNSRSTNVTLDSQLKIEVAMAMAVDTHTQDEGEGEGVRERAPMALPGMGRKTRWVMNPINPTNSGEEESATATCRWASQSARTQATNRTHEMRIVEMTKRSYSGEQALWCIKNKFSWKFHTYNNSSRNQTIISLAARQEARTSSTLWTFPSEETRDADGEDGHEVSRPTSVNGSVATTHWPWPFQIWRVIFEESKSQNN